MPLRNRVAPDGTLHAVAARGALTGNRGRIHDPATRTLLGRRWTTTAWIACELAFRDRRREVWGRGWTELFFLDEVTALAAGHRPCFECRRADARTFAAALAPPAGPAPSAPAMDARLAPDRLGPAKRTIAAEALAGLPDGAVARRGDAFLAVRSGRLLLWGFDGYRPAPAPDAAVPIAVVTPDAVLAALAGGYRPRWHPTAEAAGAP